MMFILLQTPRLTLRRFTKDDAQHLFALDNDPDVMRFINGGTPTPLAVIEEQILPGFMVYNGRFPGHGVWAAEENESGDFVGWFLFRAYAETPTEAVLGYRLRQAVWGKGYATEGVRALIDKGFAEWGLARVAATTYEYNLASRRVMEKAGLTFVKRFRLTAEDVASSDTSHTDSTEVWDGDEVEYALTRAEWAQARED